MNDLKRHYKGLDGWCYRTVGKDSYGRFGQIKKTPFGWTAEIKNRDGDTIRHAGMGWPTLREAKDEIMMILTDHGMRTLTAEDK